MITEVIILAGGSGSRLQTVVNDVPKCMAPVNGIPFIAYVIAQLKKNGIERFIFSLGYKNEVVMDYVDGHYKDLVKVFVIEQQPLGTGGAVKEACKNVQQDHVLVLNGDTLFDIDLQELADIHIKQKAVCSIALKHVPDCCRYGVVETNPNAIVTAFKEKEPGREGLINAGMYLLNAKQFLKEPLPDIFSFEKDYLEKYTNDHKFLGIAFDNYFIDIGIPEDYARAQKEAVNWFIT